MSFLLIKFLPITRYLRQKPTIPLFPQYFLILLSIEDLYDNYRQVPLIYGRFTRVL